jgi:HEAT repeat protein
MFRNIPMQVKVMSGTAETRIGLPDRFKLAANQAATLSENFIAERRWEDWGTFYDDPQAVGQLIADKVSAEYDQVRLNDLLKKALAQGSNPAQQEELDSQYNLQQIFDESDPKRRLAALDKVEPTEEMIPALGKLLDDQNVSIRRLATAYLGTIGGGQVLPHLFRALKDSSAAVRRTAGDVLSDIGDPSATGPMSEALKDPSKIVRWRAARFLYEAGDDSALPALRAAQNDPEFEVKMQIQMAIERIENGESVDGGTVWQRMIKNDPDLQ